MAAVNGPKPNAQDDVRAVVEAITERTRLIREQDTYAKQVGHATMLGFKVEQHAEAILARLASQSAPEAPGEVVAWTGSGSMMALRDGREGFIWSSSAKAHPIPLYAAPPSTATLQAKLDVARDALVNQQAALDEYYRYWTGGETRGSYDGKPEREGLWRSRQSIREALRQMGEGA